MTCHRCPARPWSQSKEASLSLALTLHSQRLSKKDKSKQTKTPTPEGLKCKRSPEILSQALLCSELIPLFLTPPQWSRQTGREKTRGLKVVSSFIVWLKTFPVSDRQDENKASLAVPGFRFLIKACVG